jgi:hypothetical protein
MLKAFAFAIVVVSFAVFAPWDGAKAASPGFCDRYVAQATSFEAQNAAKSCKLEGPRWGSDRAGHARWCRESDQESVQKEMDERAFWIGKCRQCNGYATKAVAEATDIRNKKCGYNEDDPMWSTDPEGHRSWCMGSSDESINNEIKARAGGTSSCSKCRVYARDALRMRKVLLDKGCVFDATDPRWSSDGETHFGWCMGVFARHHSGEVSTPASMLIFDQDQARRTEAGSCALSKSSQALKKGGTVKQGTAAAAPYTAVPRKKEKAETKPVEAARKPAGTGSSAMDRLGGGSSTSSASGGAGSAGSGGKARGSSDAAAPASSGGGGGGGVAPPATGVNRNAIGGGGSPERIR